MNVDTETMAGAYIRPLARARELGDAIPLLGVKVDAEIRGFVAHVRMRQRFRNERGASIEAVYVFPAPEKAAVTGLVIETGGRRIVGKVKEREAAFDEYDEALAAGHGAVLLDQHRPNIFQASVGNLLPGQEMVVELTWVMELAWEGESLRFVLPTTVAPRYAPAADRSGVGQTEAEKVNPPTVLEVPYGLRFSAEVDIPGGLAGIESPSHPLRWQLRGEGATVELSHETAAMDQDLVLLVTPASPHEPHAVTERQADGSVVAAVSFVPRFAPGPRTPREVIFLVDRSGSMQGSSIVEARRALQLALRSLHEGDRFDVIGFGSHYAAMFGASRPYTQDALEEATPLVQAMDADMGGTEILPALESALERPPAGMPRAVILLTDGEVSNEAAVIEAARAHAPATRIFTIGIGHGPSEHFVNGVARASGGAGELIKPGERIEPKVLRQLARVATPVVEDVSLQWGGEPITDRAPHRLDRIFDGEPFLVYVRLPRAGSGALRLDGRLGESSLQWEVPVDAREAPAGALIGALTARAQIRDLEEGTSRLHQEGGSRQRGRREKRVGDAILDLALRFQLASSRTSFVAVEEREGAEDQPCGQLVLVPQALTRGWHGVAQASVGRTMYKLAGFVVQQDASAADASSQRLSLDMSRVQEARRGLATGPVPDAAGPYAADCLPRKPPAVDALTLLQRADGSWPLTHELARAVGSRWRALFDLTDSLGGVGDPETVVATAIALVWLRVNAADTMDEWRLLAKKAEAWLDAALERTRYTRAEVEGLMETLV